MIEGKLAHINEKIEFDPYFYHFFDGNKADLFETRKSSVLFLIPVYSSQVELENRIVYFYTNLYPLPACTFSKWQQLEKGLILALPPFHGL